MDNLENAMNNQITLSDREAKTLIERAQHGDESARDTLVTANLRLVRSIVNRFAHRGFELDDLFQVGSIGLVKAIDGFDLSIDVRFSTYAVPKIIGEIKRFIRESSSIKISRSLKELASKAICVKDEMANEFGRAPTISELADRLQVSREEIVAALEAVAPVTSLQQIVHEGDGDLSLENQIAAAEDRCWHNVEIREALENLDPLGRKLVFMRYIAEKSQTEVAKELGISQAQVSRIEKRVLSEMRNNMPID